MRTRPLVPLNVIPSAPSTAVTAAAALLLGVLFLFTLSGAALAAPPWSDASNEFWVQTYGVTDVQVGAVAGGYTDGTFRPDPPVTRAELAKMAVSGLGIATRNPTTPTFIDVLPGTAFYIYVEGAYTAGLVKGVKTPTGRSSDRMPTSPGSRPTASLGATSRERRSRPPASSPA